MLRKFTARKSKQAFLPKGIRIYAVGDVHGRADLLKHVLARIDAHTAQNPVIRPVHLFIGDYIDRGPDSRDVLDLLIGTSDNHEAVFLKGNHEAFLLDFLENPSVLQTWGRNGGLETLMSYGLKPTLKANASAVQSDFADALGQALPKRHLDFLRNLASSFTCGDYFFAHAGVRPGVPLSAQREQDLLWIRDEFLLHEKSFGKTIVHGHTPVREIDIRSNRINIDTGAYVTGRLSCLVIEGESAKPL